jgi:hypothetical protein
LFLKIRREALRFARSDDAMAALQTPVDIACAQAETLGAGYN